MELNCARGEHTQQVAADAEPAPSRPLNTITQTESPSGGSPLHTGCTSGPREALRGRRHICVVTETFPPEVNGVALTLGHLVKGLVAQGHAVSVVRPRQRKTDFPCCTYDFGVTLVRGLPLPGYKGLQFGLPAGGRLRNAWARHRPDVVYVATEGPLGWSAVRTAQSLAIPVFSGFHTNYHVYSKYYLASWLQRSVLRYLCWFHNRTMGTLVPSVDLRSQLQTQGFKNVSFLGRGVDSHLFDPRRRSAQLRRDWGASDSEIVVLYVGRVAPEKNLRLAVDAYRAMKGCSPVKFAIVGDGPLCATLRREHRDLIFCGMHIGEALATHYASADVFLFPSETETFGNVTLEAMASGLVVLAYNYAAAKLHISNDETGVLVPYGDSRAYIEAATRLVREPRALHKMRTQAREYAVCVDWPGVVQRFEALLTGARIQGHTAPRSPVTRPQLAT